MGNRHGNLGKTNHKQVEKGTEPRAGKSKQSLLAFHTSFKLPMETTCNSENLRLGIKVTKLVKIKSDRFGSHFNWSIFSNLVNIRVGETPIV